MSRLRQHLASNVIAYLALFLSMGGTAYAAATVGSDDVINNSLKSVDLKDNVAVKSADVRDDTLVGGGLQSPDIAPDALTGADVDESTLGKVPNADTVDRLDSSAFEPAGTVTTFGPTTVPTRTQAVIGGVGPFQWIGVCPEPSFPEPPTLELKSTSGPWAFASQSHSYVGDRGEVQIPAGSQRVVIGTGSATVSAPASGYAAVKDSGKQITFNVYMLRLNDSQGNPICTFGGDMVASPGT